MKLGFVCAALLAVGLVAGLAGAGAVRADNEAQTAAAASIDFDHAGLARQFLTGYIRPKAAAFADVSSKLSADIDHACAQRSAKTLRAAVAAFRSAAGAYGEFEMVRFGPTREANRQERLVLYPDRKGLVRRQVEAAIASRDQSVTSARALAGKSVALQGFSALDILLGERDRAALLAKGEDGAFRCAYARAIGENISAIAREIAVGWSDENGYGLAMLSPGPDNPAYLKSEEVSLEIFNAFANGIEQVRDIRLAGPIGLRGLDKAATPGILENSALTLPMVAANIAGLQALYHDGGLEQRLAKQDGDIADLVDRELKTALDLARKVGSAPDLGQLSASDKTKLVSMGFPLKNAKQLASTLFGQSTGLSVGFNAGDGD